MKTAKSLIITAVALLTALLFTACSQPHPQAVDLGLPSGLKWASCNLGATQPHEAGLYLAWGESEAKDHYFYDNYRYAAEDSSQSTVDIGLEISGTEYDPACTLWSDGWRIPSRMELQELLLFCKLEWKTVKRILGVQVTGPNGNKIFLPAAGKNGAPDPAEPQCAYWTGSLSLGLGRTACSLNCSWDPETRESTLQIWGEYKVFGLTVRPVRD